MPERQDGKVKWFDPAKGYGFIEPLLGGRDVFLHASKLPEHMAKPHEGQLVTFELERNEKGFRATNVEFV